jgi:curved DNA-binding protein
MEFKDYYQILGVTEKADASAIKASYRKLARKYHPDVSKEDNAEAKFKDVGEAYAVLKDPEKRAEYDVLRTQGTTHRGGSYQPPPDWQSSYTGNRTSNQNTDGDFSDFFDSIFGASGSGFRQTEGGQRPTNRSLEDWDALGS